MNQPSWILSCLCLLMWRALRRPTPTDPPPTASGNEVRTWCCATCEAGAAEGD